MSAQFEREARPSFGVPAASGVVLGRGGGGEVRAVGQGQRCHDRTRRGIGAEASCVALGELVLAAEQGRDGIVDIATPTGPCVRARRSACRSVRHGQSAGRARRGRPRRVPRAERQLPLHRRPLVEDVGRESAQRAERRRAVRQAGAVRWLCGIVARGAPAWWPRRRLGPPRATRHRASARRRVPQRRVALARQQNALDETTAVAATGTREIGVRREGHRDLHQLDGGSAGTRKRHGGAASRRPHRASRRRARDALTRDARDYLAAITEPLRKGPAPIDVKIDVRLGDPTSGIAMAALDRQADLIVMATHARIGINRAVFGSVAGTVLRTASTPVLLIHPTAPPPPAVGAEQQVRVEFGPVPTF